MEEEKQGQRKFLQKFVRFLHFLNEQIPQLGVQKAIDWIDIKVEDDILENLNLGIIQSTVRVNFEDFWVDNYSEGKKLCRVIEREVADERWGVDETWTALSRLMLADLAVELMKKTNLLSYMGYHNQYELLVVKVSKEHDTKLDAVLTYIAGEGKHENVNKMLRYILDLSLAYEPELTPVPNATAEDFLKVAKQHGTLTS
jgi:hypothetical protein